MRFAEAAALHRRVAGRRCGHAGQPRSCPPGTRHAVCRHCPTHRRHSCPATAPAADILGLNTSRMTQPPLLACGALEEIPGNLSPCAPRPSVLATRNPTPSLPDSNTGGLNPLFSSKHGRDALQHSGARTPKAFARQRAPTTSPGTTQAVARAAPGLAPVEQNTLHAFCVPKACFAWHLGSSCTPSGS